MRGTPAVGAMLSGGLDSSSIACVAGLRAAAKRNPKLKTFSLVFVLTNGGPNHASEVVSTYLYKMGFGSFEMGYAATVGFAQMLLTAIGAWIVYRYLARMRSATGAP